MYYNKRSNANSDYYNAYSYSNPYPRERTFLNTIIKILLIVFLLVLIIFGYMFISKETQQQIMQPEISGIAKTTELKISEHISSLPQVTNASLRSNDIAQIVKIVMNKMEREESSSSLTEKQTNKNSSIVQTTLTQSDENYSKALMSQEVDELKGRTYTVELKNLNSKEVINNKPSIQASNHYNKVIIQKNKNSNLDSLSQLSNQMSSEINTHPKSKTTNYTQLITKEVAIRSNEMRIIIVQKGDTLSKLAKRAYGKYDDYIKILTANPEVIKNPDHIYVGQRLRIPAGS